MFLNIINNFEFLRCYLFTIFFYPTHMKSNKKYSSEKQKPTSKRNIQSYSHISSSLCFEFETPFKIYLLFLKNKYR